MTETPDPAMLQSMVRETNTELKPYVCHLCGALVYLSSGQLHLLWHNQLEEILEETITIPVIDYPPTLKIVKDTNETPQN